MNRKEKEYKHKSLRVLIAGEKSQIITRAFLAVGADAYSCDIQSTDGDPSRHLQCDWKEAVRDAWGLLIAHPVCTKLSNCGNKWYVAGNWTTPEAVEQRKEERELAIQDFLFFKSAVVAHIPRRAIENPNPSGYVMQKIGRHDQKVQPWWFGDLETKGICWWKTENLPHLIATNNVYEEMMKLPYKQRARVHSCPPGINRSNERSRFFPGAAKAMAESWT